MMTRISDYLLSAPTSDADITGNIIPVADIEGKDATLRKEDYYYLRELWSAFRNSGSAYTTGFSASNFRFLISSILSYMNQWKSDSSLGFHTHMKSGLPSYSFTGSLHSGSGTFSNQFFNWMKNNNAIELLDTSETAPSAGLPMDANILRLLYWFLSKDMFRQVRDSSLEGARAFAFATQETSIPYTYPSLDAENNVVTVSTTRTIQGGSGGQIMVSGSSYGGEPIGVHVLKKWDSDAGKYKYYNSLCFPSSTVSANVTFSAPVSDAYALMNISLTGHNTYQGLQLLRPMTGGGTNWSVEFVKKSDFDLASGNISYPTFDEWGETSGNTYFYNASVECVFAKFSNPYFALPSEWDWSPS